MIFNKLLDPTLVGLLIPGEGVEHTLKREQRSVLLDRHSEAQCCHRREGEVLLYLTKTIDILPQKESPGLQLPWCNLCVQFGGEIPVLVEEALTFWSVFFKTKERRIGCFWDQCNVTALCGQKELWSKSISVSANISFLLHSGQGQFGRGSMEYIKCFYVGFSLSLRSSSSCDYQKSIPWVCTPTRTINNILSSKAQQCLHITGRGRQADLWRADPMQLCQGTDEVPATRFGLYTKYFKCFKCTNISFKFRQNNILLKGVFCILFVFSQDQMQHLYDNGNAGIYVQGTQMFRETENITTS